jgi:hypothetical protein
MFMKRGGNKRGRDKRALTPVVITLILAAVVLIALGIALFVIREDSGQSDISSSQIDASVKGVSVDENTNSLTFLVERGEGEGDLTGFKFVLSDGSDSETIEIDSYMDEYDQGLITLDPDMDVSQIRSITLIPLIRGREAKKQYVKDYKIRNLPEIESEDDEEEDYSGGGCTSESTEETCGTAVCGVKKDNCNRNVNCGTCESGETCFFGACVSSQCTPTNCSNLDYQCGIHANGSCTGTINCGNCSEGYQCITGKCFLGQCTPANCTAKGYECGIYSNGTCAGVLNCNTQGCGTRSSCNLTGACVCNEGYADCDNDASNNCECNLGTSHCTGTNCVANPCIPESKTATCGTELCGVKRNNCNQDISCGTCPIAEPDCVSGVCQAQQWQCTPEPKATTCGTIVCGAKKNNCDQDVSCGACPADKPNCVDGACVATQSVCYTSSGSFQSFSMTKQEGLVTIEYNATPNNNNMDGVTMISNRTITQYTDSVISLRFNLSGKIQALSGSSYKSDETVSYTAGTKYHFRIVADVPSKKYDVYVTPAGQSEVQIANDYIFRGSASAGHLNRWGIIADYDGSTSHKICDFKASSSSPPTNHAPVINTNPVLTLNEGSVYYYDVDATDADGDVLTYSFVQAPPWLSIDSQNGKITGGSGISVAEDSGFTVKVKVSDEKVYVTQNYTLTVKNVPETPTCTSHASYACYNGDVYWYNSCSQREERKQDCTSSQTCSNGVCVVADNYAPIITSTPVTTVNEGAQYTYEPYSTDPTDNLRAYQEWSLTTKPSWLSIDVELGEISGTAPSNLDQDTGYAVTVKVLDTSTGLSDTQSYTLTVKNRAGNPEITSVSITTVNEGSTYYYSLYATDPTDADFAHHSWSLPQAPSWLSLGKEPGGRLTGEINGTAPWVERDTNYTVTVKVLDTSTGLSDTQSYTLTVKNRNCVPTGLSAYCVNPGVKASDGTCLGATNKPHGTPCPTVFLPALNNACDGQGHCSISSWSGKGCSQCPFGYREDTASRDWACKPSSADPKASGRYSTNDGQTWTNWAQTNSTNPLCSNRYRCDDNYCREDVSWRLKPTTEPL